MHFRHRRYNFKDRKVRGQMCVRLQEDNSDVLQRAIFNARLCTTFLSALKAYLDNLKSITRYHYAASVII